MHHISAPEHLKKSQSVIETKALFVAPDRRVPDQDTAQGCGGAGRRGGRHEFVWGGGSSTIPLFKTTSSVKTLSQMHADSYARPLWHYLAGQGETVDAGFVGQAHRPSTVITSY